MLRLWIPFLLLSALVAPAAEAQTRPALLGSGPTSLIDMVDTQKIAAAGMKDGLVMFTVFVTSSGVPKSPATFRESKGSKPLVAELRRCLERCRFVPATYKGTPVPTQYFGTALIFTAGGKPRLRIFSNNNLEDVKSQADFIAPQLILGTSDWNTAKHMMESARTILRSGTCEVAITVDTEGFVKGIKVLNENPSGYRFGEATVKEMEKARFIPGFRNGRPVNSTFVYTQLLRASVVEFEQPMHGSLLPPR